MYSSKPINAEPEPEFFKDDELSGAQESTVVAWMAGERMLTGHDICPVYGLRAQESNDDPRKK